MKNERDPWSEIPPEWVKLHDVPMWMERCFDVPGTPIIQLLVTAIQSGKIFNRVIDLQCIIHKSTFPPGIGEKVMVQKTRTYVAVHDWVAADFDPKSGTVAGFGEEEEKPKRHLVFAWWPEVQSCFSSYIKNARDKRKFVKEEPINVRKNIGGAPVKHDWDLFWIEVSYWTGINGIDQRDRVRLQKHLENFSAEKMQPAPEPATIRGKLKMAYKRFGESN